MSRQFHYFLAARLCFPALAHHFHRQFARVRFTRFPQCKCPTGLHVFAMHDFHRPSETSEHARFLIPINVLNGAKRLNGLNDLNGLRYLMAHGIALLLERRFQREKAVPKLLNRAYSALFFS